jgi:hypothetical protein
VFGMRERICLQLDEMKVILASPDSTAVASGSEVLAWEQYGAAELQLFERV